MAKETFGSAIGKVAREQIKLREELFAKPNKTPEELDLINGSTSWVQLRSSVNKVTNPEILTEVRKGKTPPSSITTDGGAEARKFVLIGGTHVSSASGRHARSGVNLNEGDNSKFAYNVDSITGYRPMPGITGLKVASKNTYGTLLQAEVDFVVWSLSDLEICELLYFRPGYTALLEWGHTSFLTAKDQVKQYGKHYYPVIDSVFFDAKPRPITIDKAIQKDREETKGNAEGMFGYITNFSWSFRPDGGYNCSIKLVSRNIVLESLKNGKVSDNFSASDEDQEKSKEERKSNFHYVFTELEKFKTRYQTSVKSYLNGKGTKKAKEISESLMEDFDLFRTTIDLGDEGTNLFGLYTFDKTANIAYIPLRGLLAIFNSYESLYNPKPKEKVNLLEFDLSYGEKYNTFNNHYSIDPIVAVLPKTPVDFPDRTLVKDGLDGLMKAYAGSNADDIMNIMISTEFIKAEIGKIIDTTGGEGIGIFDTMKNILAILSDTLGGINDFDVVYDYYGADQKLRVIDRSVPHPVKNIPTLSLAGLSSTVTELNVSSKITSAIASQVSIAAQGNQGNATENISAILKWNSGAIDRHIPIKKKGVTEPSKEQKEAREQFLKDLEEAFAKTNDGSHYSRETFRRLKLDNQGEIQKLYLDQQKEVVQGVVPVELSIKMLGISGLKIGSTFKIASGILPKKYDKFGYIITGIEHELDTSNRWYTNIKTQFYNIK